MTHTAKQIVKAKVVRPSAVLAPGAGWVLESVISVPLRSVKKLQTETWHCSCLDALIFAKWWGVVCLNVRPN